MRITKEIDATLDIAYRVARVAIIIATVIPLIVLVIICRDYDELIDELWG